MVGIVCNVEQRSVQRFLRLKCCLGGVAGEICQEVGWNAEKARCGNGEKVSEAVFGDKWIARRMERGVLRL
jgi:hypothetical protein